VRLGVNVPNFGPGTDPGALERWTRTVEDLGFDLLMVSDHVAVTPDVAQRYPAPFYDPFTTLAWLAGRTQRMLLGTTVVIMPYRHPLLTAQTASNLDQLSGGRLVLGVGVGWARKEFAALGLPFAERGAMTDDFLAALRAVWSGDEIASYQGAYVSFEDVGTSLRPVGGRDGAPPVWIGGHSGAALRRAVRFGDAWHPLALTIPEMRDGLSRLVDVAGEMTLPVPGFAPRIKFKVTDAETVGDDRQPGVGTLGQIRADLETIRALGAETVVFDPYHGDPAETLHPEDAWRDLAAIIGKDS
jgi:probable F420-dependent oxidoreductase